MSKCKILFIENQISQFETIVEFFEKFNKEILKEIISYIQPGVHDYDNFINSVREYLDNDCKPEIKHKVFTNILSFINTVNINDKFYSIIFDIYPKHNPYDDFIDNIRVYLNNNYKDEIKVRALTNILSSINAWNAEEKFDFVIIDHKLVGCHNSKSGIHLAELLKKHNSYNYKIIFLSRNTTNDKQVTKEFAEVSLATSDYIWITKGYAGVAILQEDYFRKQVIEKIKNLFQDQHKLSYATLIMDTEESVRLLSNSIPGLLDSQGVESILQGFRKIENEKPQGKLIQTLNEINTSIINIINEPDFTNAKNIVEKLKELFQ